MNDNLQPLGNDPLEARITAWVLGEASPFEAAELEALCSENPELRIFHLRTLALHNLLKEAQASEADRSWKLPPSKREKLDSILGSHEAAQVTHQESRVRRASFRAAWGIAAILILTFFTKRFLIIPGTVQNEELLSVFYSAEKSSPPQASMPAMKERMMELSEGERNAFKISNAKDANTSGEKLEIADDRRAKESVLRHEASAEPSARMGKSIAANSASNRQIPLPELDAVELSANFGDGDDFGGDLNDSESADKQSAEAYSSKIVKRSKALTRASEEASESSVDESGGTLNRVQASPASSSLAQGETKAKPALSAERENELSNLSVSDGLRSGDVVIERNSIDAVLNKTVDTKAPRRPSAPAASAPAPAASPTSEMSTLAQREIVRRQDALTEADEKLLDGRNAYAKGDYAEAVENYKKAIENLPDAPATVGRRESYTEHLSDASIARAREFRKVGKYDEARELLKQAETSAPANGRIKDEIAFLDDPLRTNPALTYEHAGKVDEVRRNLHKAQGNYDLGKYDDAKKAYEDTLRIDPYNSAARRGMEKISATKSDYYRAAYDNTRSELLTEVDSAWELAVPAEVGTTELSPPPGAKGAKGAEGADQDARAELLAEVDRAWDLAVPADAVEKKKGEAKEVDPFASPAAPGEHSPAFTGVWNSFESKDSGKSRYAWWVDDASQKASVKAGEHPSQSELFFADSAFNANSTSGGWKVDLADHLTGFTGNLDGFVNYGAPIAGESKQVDITTKYVETTQANNAELGFDWIVSPFSQKGNISNGTVIPVTPATPTEFESYFESRISGGTLEVKEGGLRKDLTEAVSKVDPADVPHLEDLPLFGRLFKPQPIDLADLSQEIHAVQEPFSTFSLNISDASFQIAHAAVEKGERPDPESIKPEQFYNAVDYGDPAPSSLEPVSAAIDQTAHPVIPGRNLVRVAIRTASTGRSAAQPLRLTLLVDQSGSMARADRRAAMDTALAQLATLLTENDRITVIGFSRTPRLIADSLPGNEANKISALVNPTASEGGTNLEQALNLSSELALRHKLDGAQNRIVLFTDGAANLGDADPDRLSERVKELRQQGLAFDIAGIGTNDTNDRLLGELARHGNGRYYLVGENTGDSLAAQLAGAFRPAAENVKVQVRLNPERVGNYKLIGFEKDRLKTEDFRDDTVDAAELAADEAGVAIYQVETLPEGAGEIGEVSVRFRDTASGEMVERAWTIPHDPSAPAFDKADPKTQLATLSLLAAQKLQGGPLADAIRFADHTETIARLKQTYANDAKAQRLLYLINALR